MKSFGIIEPMSRFVGWSSICWICAGLTGCVAQPSGEGYQKDTVLWGSIKDNEGNLLYDVTADVNWFIPGGWEGRGEVEEYTFNATYELMRPDNKKISGIRFSKEGYFPFDYSPDAMNIATSYTLESGMRKHRRDIVLFRRDGMPRLEHLREGRFGTEGTTIHGGTTTYGVEVTSGVVGIAEPHIVRVANDLPVWEVPYLKPSDVPRKLLCLNVREAGTTETPTLVADYLSSATGIAELRIFHANEHDGIQWTTQEEYESGAAPEDGYQPAVDIPAEEMAVLDEDSKERYPWHFWIRMDGIYGKGYVVSIGRGTETPVLYGAIGMSVNPDGSRDLRIPVTK